MVTTACLILQCKVTPLPSVHVNVRQEDGPFGPL